jgi:sugar phosphate isomerase/epimerase
MMKRRTFLAGLLSTASVGQIPAVAHAASNNATGMTLGFSSYGAKSLTTERSIDLLADVGFDSIELTIWPEWDADPAVLKPARRATLRQQLADRGLRLTSLMEHLHIDEKDRTAAQRLERIRLAAELAHDLSPDNPPLLQTTIGGGGEWTKARDIYATEISDWLKVANAADLVIAVKPHRGGAFSRPDEAVELIELLGKPLRLRMCYDYAHYDFRDMTLADTIKTSLPYVAHVAVKDVIQKDGKTRFVLPGEGGRIDYAQLIKQFHDGGYRGDICCEVSGQVWSQPGYDPVDCSKTCYAHMAGAFTKAGIIRN